MKNSHFQIFFSVRLIALVVGMVCLPALADEYADVSQLVRAGKPAEALVRADQFLATQPKDPQMRFIKGVILRDTGKTAEAIATFTKLTEDYPELPEPYNNLAVMYASQSQFDKARNALEMAIRTNPSYATAHENLGDIYAKLASQAYNKALQLDNGNQAVPPKLALIRDIFSPNTALAKLAPRPTTTVVATPQVPAVASTPAGKPIFTTVVPPVAVAAITPPKSTVAAPIAAPAAVSTPAPTLSAKPTAPVAADSEAVEEVKAAVEKWASLWAARDVKGYLAAYGTDFDPPGSLGRKAWEEERRVRINGKASISVKVDRLKVSVDGHRATAKFRQDYKAGGLAIASNKTLELSKAGSRWLIVKESVGN